MRDGMDMSAQDCGKVFSDWNSGTLQSYLIEISGKVADATDEETGKPVLDIILDRAGQKGTGRWTVMSSAENAVVISTINTAVEARIPDLAEAFRKLSKFIIG